MDQQAVSRTILSELFIQWDSYASCYEDVAYGAALVGNGEEWKSVTTFFIPARRGFVSDIIRIDYGELMIVRGSLTLSAAKTALTGIVEGEFLNLPDAPA